MILPISRLGSDTHVQRFGPEWTFRIADKIRPAGGSAIDAWETAVQIEVDFDAGVRRQIAPQQDDVSATLLPRCDLAGLDESLELRGAIGQDEPGRESKDR